MPAPKGNQFAKGNRGGGRKGYEFEKEQLERMKKLLDGILTLAEKILKGKATRKQIEYYDKLMKLALKIMDKIHANRQHIEGEIRGEIETEIKLKDLKDYIKWRKQSSK